MAKPYRTVGWLHLLVCATLVAGLRVMSDNDRRDGRVPE
jgi:hypothetical protein